MADPFAAEMWSWYALTIFIVGARLLSRRLLFQSFRRLQSDDWIMVLALGVHTGLLVVIWILTYTPTNLINPDHPLTLTPADVKRREYGSKLVLVTEQLTLIVLWSCKACLLILYSRLTMTLKHNLLVKIVAGYTVVGYVVTVVLWFFWCRPFHFYWKVPSPADLNCSAETNHMITSAFFNISSDILIICLPMPVLLQSQLPLKRKLTLAGVFALGSFTILAAIMSKYYSLGKPYGQEWIFWYIREVSTAIITTNLPLTWTLLQRIFGMGSFLSRHGRSSERSGTGPPSKNRLRSTYGNLSSAAREDSKPKKHDPYAINVSPSESQEKINGDSDIRLKIWQQHRVEVTTEELDSKDGDSMASQRMREDEITHAPSKDPEMGASRKSSRTS
ncbi:hypothetical protein P154DRAFT_523118 [Amniculicola lignicola CBS 123094]|uniref:Rhodopsin domain-containing protein n=1 Tax=Amniculicola lignicola CBS 123094 TaxID=1392246 RepID=A0A6A5WL46_9PLEO|nr:hypothetical protein P154DRAFT_523118 [Amniculicola lignicola CBS 123094]